MCSLPATGEQMECKNRDCRFHRCAVVHVVGDCIMDHVQGSWEELMRRLPEELREIYPSRLYRHGMLVDELRHAAMEEAA